MATINPTDARRRSFVYRRLLAAGATFESLGEGTVTANLARGDRDAVERLAICDLSGLPRIGFKGRDTLDWLRARGFDCSDTPNRTYLQTDGVLVAVLAPTEALLLSPLNAPALPLLDLADACSLDDGVRRYPVPRADTNFEFLVSGRHSAEMFSKICGVDLRSAVFAADAVAQTSVARLNAIVVRSEVGDIPAYRILGDSASAEYMWEVMLDAMAEYAGVAVGLADVVTE
ncbi:MAG: sarcosine oxidase [Alphaproteobacteria bacterium]|nr:sarcosine oxidase [Alphaproteobacteria bacterium]